MLRVFTCFWMQVNLKGHTGENIWSHQWTKRVLSLPEVLLRCKWYTWLDHSDMRHEGSDAYMGQGQNQFSSGSSGGHCCLSLSSPCHVRPVSVSGTDSDVICPQTNLCKSSCHCVFCVQSEPGTQAVHFPPLQISLHCIEHCSNSSPHMHRGRWGVGGAKEGVGLCG